MNKGGLKAKREKLAADRFKIKNTEGNLRSKTEVTLMKKLAKKGPVAPVKKEVELFDVWGGSSITGAPKLVDPSKRVQKFKDFSKRSMTRVKPVMAPHAGQSVNPALQAHKEVLKKVISEEEKEIEENYKGSFQRTKDSGKDALAKLKEAKKQRKSKADAAAGEEGENGENDDSASEDSDDSGSSSGSDDENSDIEEGKTRKPVDRLKKLTINQRNQKKVRKDRNQAYIDKAHERKMAKQYDKIQLFINLDKKETKEQNARIQKRQEDAKAEKML